MRAGQNVQAFVIEQRDVPLEIGRPVVCVTEYQLQRRVVVGPHVSVPVARVRPPALAGVLQSQAISMKHP